MKCISNWIVFWCFALSILTKIEAAQGQLPDGLWVLPYNECFEDLPNSIYYEPELEPVILLLVASPNARALLDAVLKKGPFIVKSGFATESHLVSVWRDVAGRTMVVDKEESWDMQLGNLLFQLAYKLVNEDGAAKLSRGLERGHVSQGRYVERVLYFDYDASRLMYEIASSGISSYSWPEGAKLYMDSIFVDSDTSWETYVSRQANSYSARWYRADWNVNFKRKYCEANPESDGCLSGLKTEL